MQKISVKLRVPNFLRSDAKVYVAKFPVRTCRSVPCLCVAVSGLVVELEALTWYHITCSILYTLVIVPATVRAKERVVSWPMGVPDGIRRHTPYQDFLFPPVPLMGRPSGAYRLDLT